jgi:ABC-type nitrate/sulfonate/bicarbonate transport system ATPase subunit
VIRFEQVSFSYGKKEVLKDLSFTLENNTILAVMGPSGCGKTTLLQLAAGLRKPQSGKIATDAARISYVFQEPRLFPWMTVRENVAAVMNEKDKTIANAQIDELLRLVGLDGSAALLPAQLSGGMKSRVSLARALAYDGELYLLDEPFSALDEALREELTSLLLSHLRQRKASAILVTHQRADAERLADRVMELTPLS